MRKLSTSISNSTAPSYFRADVPQHENVLWYVWARAETVRERVRYHAARLGEYQPHYRSVQNQQERLEKAQVELAILDELVGDLHRRYGGPSPHDERKETEHEN